MNIHHINTQEVLDRISRNCPEALSAYLHCVNRVSSSGCVFFDRDMIENDMSESFIKFKNNIKKLARENLLEWHELDGGLNITLADVHEDE